MGRPPKTISETPNVLELLMDPKVQKELSRINPKFNRADLLDAILESWPNGQEGFAKDVYGEFSAAPRGSGIRQAIIKLVTNLISEESALTDLKPTSELTDDELKMSILSIAPVLSQIKEDKNDAETD